MIHLFKTGGSWVVAADDPSIEDYLAAMHFANRLNGYPLTDQGIWSIVKLVMQVEVPG